MQTAKISGWGNYPVAEARVKAPARVEDCPVNGTQSYLPRGLGRSYGDASLPGPRHDSLDTRFLKHFLDFDPATGVLEAESGVSLKELLDTFVPKGWFLPVTPGTKFVTLGGAVASNVHGKNHHRVGSIENFIESLRVRTPIGTFDCSPTQRPDLFRGTIAGYGLTGLVERVKLRLRPIESAYIRARNLPAAHLDALFEHFEQTNEDPAYPGSVAWIDTLATGKHLGRSVLMIGDHARIDELDARRAKDPLSPPHKPKLTFPFFAPEFALSPLTMRCFNQAIYMLKGRSDQVYITDYDDFYYPLDWIHKWNRMYGRRGFLQYQFIIPDPYGKEGIARSLRFLSERGIGSFLSILKRYGDDHAIIPFAKQGYSLALDIPYRSDTLEQLRKLDAIVLDYGGRVYLSKDARLPAETFRAMYPTEHLEWREVIAKYNPHRSVWSAMAERLEL